MADVVAPVRRHEMFSRSASPRESAQFAAVLGFIALVPGFALYQLALYLGLIGPFLGGYLGIVGVVVFASLLPFFLISLATRRTITNANDWLFFSFMLIFVGVGFYYLGDLIRFQNAEEKLLAVPQVLSYYFIFRIINLETKPVRILIFSSMIICLIVMRSLDLGVFNDQGDGVALVESYRDSYANYQFFGMIYLFCSLSFIPSINKAYARIFIYILSGWVLYLNGARSEFIVFAISAGLIEFYLSKSKIIFFLMIMALIFVLMQSVQYILSSEGAGRISSLFIEGSGDASVVDRRYTIDMALDTIRRSPFFGDFSNHEPGFYAHNFLSAWADFGIIGFAIFVSAIILCLRNAAKVFFNNHITPQFVAMAAMAISGAFLFLFAKAYPHPIFGVMLALSAQYSQFCDRNGFSDARRRGRRHNFQANRRIAR